MTPPRTMHTLLLVLVALVGCAPMTAGEKTDYVQRLKADVVVVEFPDQRAVCFMTTVYGGHSISCIQR